ncbi:MAG: DUF5056 domain-containing protein [Bacteroides sp.]|nr:DUF5056 domain-containing protein [Bacteroides sp.]
MQENDDKLIEQFLAAGKQEIADNGFSRRVVQRLPRRESLLSRLWTGFCFALALVLFFVFDGWQAIQNTVYSVFENLVQQGQTDIAQTDPKSLIVAGIVLIYLAYRKIATLA